MWIYVNNNRCRSTSFSFVYYHKVQYVVLECERDVKLTCLINPPQCLTQMPKIRPILQLLNSSSISNPRNTTNIWWLHTKHMFLPMIWHSCIYSITPCAAFTSLALYVSLCVCPSIDSNENNRFGFYQP
jgi:hypothetical protein